jgi:uncharacterized protein (TIGR03437 family)
MLSKSWLMAVVGVMLMANSARAGTFGQVVVIGGEAADIALDEARGVLYVANFTANRIDVMSLDNHQIQTSINVPAQPSSISMSPDGHWLLAANYGNNTAPASATNALTLIDLTANNAKQTFALGNPPLGVAFGLDNRALVVTTQEFILFDPALGTTQVLQTITQVATNALPQPAQSFPGNIVQASVTASRDGTTIAGFGGTSPYLLFRYNVVSHAISGSFYTSSPAAGPRVVSLSDDGSLTSIAWWVMDANFITTAQYGNPAGLLNVGSHVIDSSRNLIYAQIPVSGTSATANTTPPVLLVVDSDNLTVRQQIKLPENLAGKSLLSADHNTMYSISDSGVMILPVGSFNSAPRVVASAQDLVFRGNLCVRSIISQTLDITDPGGGNTPFTISTTTSGINVSPSSGVTPATVTVSVDPNAFQAQKGTVTASLNISSNTAVNMPASVRVLINSEDPSQRGSFVNIPGTVVDILADPKRNVYYILRQDNNQVLIFNATNNTQTGTLRTCTTPRGMAITFDQQYLLVGCDNSHYMDWYDLDLLQAQPPIAFPGDYVQSVAASANAILVHLRSGTGGTPGLGQVDLASRTGTRLKSLGVYQNTLPPDTVLASSGNGSNILIASADGSVMLYDANVGSFTVSRKDFSSLGGAYAASSFNQYVVGTNILDGSGVPIGTLPGAAGSSSGFAFVNVSGYYTTAPNATSPGVIAQVNLSNGGLIQPTALVEAPLLGSTPAATTGTNTTNTTNCTGTTTTNCTTTTTLLFSPSIASVWTRSLAPLPSQTEIVSLSTSGLTVLPWNYSASVPTPKITSVVSAADGKSPIAPGGLIEVLGMNLSPTNVATNQMPLPTALANSCLTVNGQPVPIVFVSPNEINAQLPLQAVGNETFIVHTPGGTSDNFNVVIAPNAPAIFLTGVSGPDTNVPTLIRAANNLLVTDSNPVHRGDMLVIYLTGLGQTNPAVTAGQPSPSNPLATTVTPPIVTLGGQNLPVVFSGLSPGEIGVYQINVDVPGATPLGLSVPLTITQSGFSTTINVRVVS